MSAATIRHDVGPDLYLQLGALPVFDSVGLLEGATPSFNFLCSGTLIAADWVHHPGWIVNNPLGILVGNGIGVVYLLLPATDVLPAIKAATRRAVWTSTPVSE